MRSNVLISRLVRLVETVGASGDGAQLAEEYAQAVERANNRLESVITAADAHHISDAIRILSEDPPLLEEVSALDFFQFPDWENLCEMNGWQAPPKVDSKALERVIEIGERKDAIAPFLTMYKKAIRVNNTRLAVKSLRRLVELDSTQDWMRNLRQSERQLQALIVEEFLAAKKKGAVETCERLIAELLDGVWCDGLMVKGVDDLKAFRDELASKKRAQEGREDIEILEKCLKDKWDRKLAFSLVQAVDVLIEKRWAISDEEREILEACRARCASEFAAEEREKQWRKVNETLHAAIQNRDCAAIRDALSAPEFLDRDPIDNLLSQAQRVLDHEESSRRRKTFQIVAASFLGVVAVVAVSAWWLKRQMYISYCENQVRELAKLVEQANEHPSTVIDGLSVRLTRLKNDEPEVYAYPSIFQFETSLKVLKNETYARTNQINSIICELEQGQATSWKEGLETASNTDRMSRVERLLTKDDTAYRTRFLKVKHAWLDAVENHRLNQHDRAAKFHATLVAHLAIVTERLKKELARQELTKEVENSRSSLEEWKHEHSAHAEELAAELNAAEKAFNEAVEEQHDYVVALEKLRSAKTASDVLSARSELIESFGYYPEVKRLKALEVTIDDVTDVLSVEPKILKDYVAGLKGGISPKAFEEFLKDNVLLIADSPEFYSLYGLYNKNDANSKIIAVSKGRPEMSKASFESMWKTTCESGTILNFNKTSVVSEIKTREKLTEVLMPSSDEMKTIVEIANRNNLTIGAFENEIRKLIRKHIEKGHEKDFMSNEVKYAKYDNPVRGWMSPYRRVQFLAWYMRWLKEDLNLMPHDKELEKWYEKLDRYSNVVSVDGVDDSISWICVWDYRVRKRTNECAKLLSEIPADWTDRYLAAKNTRRELATIGGWTVMYAGTVKFDPLDPNYEKKPDAIAINAPRVEVNHPLYVLRRVNNRLVLMRAFEPGKKSWRRCADVESTNDGYIFGEPLYHVFADGKYIDVEEELGEIAKRAKLSLHDRLFQQIPLFTNGGR